MNKCIALILILLALVFGNENEEKLVYITQETYDLSEVNYIGQLFSVKYNVLPLSSSKILNIDFVEENNSGLSVKNKDSSWKELEDGSLENVFHFKIKSTQFSLPQLQITFQKDESENLDSILSESIQGNAISLRTKPKYSGVVAKEIYIQDYSIKEYDDKNNIVLLQLYSTYSNLEDMKFKEIANQGFKNSSFNILESSGIYYAVIPKDMPVFEFDYFNINDRQYKTIKIKNIINNKEQNVINEDLKPINQILIFNNIFIFFIIIACIILLFIRKIPLKIKIFSLIVILCLVLYLITTINIKKEAILKSGSYVRILPVINNSTIIAKIDSDTKVRILHSYNNYYKIAIDDNVIGWVNQNELK